MAQKGVSYTVSGVVVPPEYRQWLAQLEDIGFLSGEHVAVMARGLPGGDPLVVRVGLSTFALRLVEAACVYIVPTGLTAT